MFVDWQVADDPFEVGEPFNFKYGSTPSYGCNAERDRKLEAAREQRRQQRQLKTEPAVA